MPAVTTQFNPLLKQIIAMPLSVPSITIIKVSQLLLCHKTDPICPGALSARFII